MSDKWCLDISLFFFMDFHLAGAFFKTFARRRDFSHFVIWACTGVFLYAPLIGTNEWATGLTGSESVTGFRYRSGWVRHWKNRHDFGTISARYTPGESNTYLFGFFLLVLAGSARCHSKGTSVYRQSHRQRTRGRGCCGAPCDELCLWRVAYNVCLHSGKVNPRGKPALYARFGKRGPGCSYLDRYLNLIGFGLTCLLD